MAQTTLAAPGPTRRAAVGLAPQSRPKSAPAAGLRLGCADLLRKFVRRGLVVDPGIIRRADEAHHWRDRGGARPGKVGAGTKQWRRRRGDSHRFGRRGW